jgi:DNA-binding transcriptional ArsR family regulator
MKLRREYRHRDESQVAILESLADRQDEGMTVFELRSRVGVDIDELEQALSALQADGLISATEQGDRTLITVDERVLTEEEGGNGERDFFERVIDRFGL